MENSLSLQQLNEQQMKAVVYDDGPSLVIAGAGSGKTRVLTNKILYLIQKGYDPYRIVALTFTNKAAREMRERIGSLLGNEISRKIWMGTFHSIFLKILRFNCERIGFKSDFTIYDTADTKSVIKSIIKERELDDKKYTVNSVMNSISNAKNALILPLDYECNKSLMDSDNYHKRPLTVEIYREYMQRCQASNAMDFDDILLFINILMRDNPDVLARYQDFFQYVLVDEYQDINFAQHLIVSQLCKEHQRLCVVGDDAQSIYSFRGANISNILNLDKQYPNLKIFKLEQNYRSTQTILDAANSLIKHNTQQIPKKIFSENAKGSKIPIISAYNDMEEGILVSKKIHELKMLQRDSYDDFAVLYRTNAQSRLIEESLRKINIPYRIYGGLSFYQRKEIKDALGYFRMAVNPDDDSALIRVINYPARGIGAKTVEKIHQSAILNDVSMWSVLCNPKETGLDVNSGTLKKIEGFRSLIQSYIDLKEEKNAYDLACFIFSTAKLNSSFYEDNTPENISKRENLEELIGAINQFVEKQQEENEEASMLGFLSEVSLITDQDMKDNTDSPKVSLMTVHAAKGLEFKNVFIVGVEDEFFPSMHSAGSLKEIEEERRLLYVAITRAKSNCIMSYASMRFQNGQTRPCSKSRFLNDIDSTLLNETGHKSFTNKFDNYDSQRYGFREEPAMSLNTKFIPVTKSENRPQSSSQIKGNESYSILNLKDIHLAMKVKHIKFGIGEIVRIDDRGVEPKIAVRFENENNEKLLLLKFARLSIVE